jgi:hypothetical protein
MELFVLVGVTALVITVLKGRGRLAAGVVAAAVALVAVMVALGDVSEGEISGVTLVLLAVGPLLWSVLAIWAATRPAEAGSYWDRRRSVDDAGVPVIASRPLWRRLARGLVGAMVGVLPALALMTAVLVAADTGDEAQIAFVGIPFGLVGLLIGGVVGFNWVPRSGPGPPDASVDEPDPASHGVG